MDGWTLLGHLVGPWQTRDVGGLPTSERRRQLTFAVVAVDVRCFELVGAVNAGAFLGVASGLLLCEDVVVGVHFETPQAGDRPTLAEQMASRQRRTLTFRFVEQAARGWNEFLLPAGAGKAERVRLALYPEADFAAVFGNAHFPEGAANDTRSG
jgi:hypothetical protein